MRKKKILKLDLYKMKRARIQPNYKYPHLILLYLSCLNPCFCHLIMTRMKYQIFNDINNIAF